MAQKIRIDKHKCIREKKYRNGKSIKDGTNPEVGKFNWSL